MRQKAIALALLLFAGCGEGGPPPEDQVRSTVAAFARATEARDYAALCDRILAPKLIEDVESIGLPCEAALRRGLGRVKEPRLTIGRISVEGDRASAEVRTTASGQEPSRDTLRLVKVGDSWKISSLGS